MKYSPLPHRAPPAGTPRRASPALVWAAALLALGGCALQPAYVAPELQAPTAWSANTPLSYTVFGRPPVDRQTWWRALGDGAIDTLTEAALADSPTLAQALARIDEARASAGGAEAARWPTFGASAGLARAQSQNTASAVPGATIQSTSANAGPQLSWEIDLFGRVRQSVEAARSRLDARTADASSAQLALTADIANSVVSLRACENGRRVLVNDIASREKTLALTRLRLRTGFAAPVDEARATSGLATTRTSLAQQDEQCTRLVNALVALSGQDARKVRQLIVAPEQAAAAEPVFMPTPPVSTPALPATVLARHPSVVSAEREVAAAWAEVGVARANRLPRLDLAAALTGQWIRAAGSSLDFTTWSLGPSLTGTLFDGGAGAANVSGAEARYRRAAAGLQGTLRSTVQEVENALAAQASASARGASTRDGVTAARTTLQASEAQWKAGAISLFELEDSRRQLASTQDAEIAARRDQTQAWVALVKATGGHLTSTLENFRHD
jgi:outer membrane protein, multidrug efflux system